MAKKAEAADKAAAVDSKESAAKKHYVSDTVRSINFHHAGIKVTGAEVDLEWQDFKKDKNLLASLLERGLVVLK